MGKGRKMKNWKRWLAAGCMAALLGIGTMGTTVMAMGGGGVDRSEAVAEEEKVPGPGQPAQQQAQRHGRNSTESAITEADRSWKGLLQEELMFQSGRILSTGARLRSPM